MDSNLIHLANSLIDDALDLLPASVSARFAPDNDMTSLMHGVEDGPAAVPTLNGDAKTIGRTLALMLTNVYRGYEATSGIPQVVFYEGFRPLTTSDFSSGLAEIRTDKERYSKALSYTVNILLTASQAKTGPLVGVYLRDSQSNLYIYESGQ